jgi:methionyl aminopeptidase
MYFPVCTSAHAVERRLERQATFSTHFTNEQRRIVMQRNDPCWCGSGKKYKRCHMHEDSLKDEAGRDAALKRMTKTPEQIEGMRRAGAFNGRLVDYIRPFVKAGVSTDALNELVHEYTVRAGHAPATLGYHGYPKSICTSINDVVCHGIPSPSEILKTGDIVNVDITTIVDGFFGDSSETFFIGDVSAGARHLVRVAAQALLRGIQAVRPGRPLRAVAEAIDPFVQSQGCSVVRQYTGHGIGQRFHENFTVYHHLADNAEEIILLPGMTFTIEPMINLGDYRVVTSSEDGWTVRTKDGTLSAQFEHTVLVVDDGVEVLTLTPSQRAAGKIVLADGTEMSQPV